MINENVNKIDNITDKSQTSEELLNAIKLVAKEMANAVKSVNKKTIPPTNDENYKDKIITTEYQDMKENSVFIENDMTREESEVYIPKGEIFVSREAIHNNADFYERNIIGYNNLQHRLELERYNKIVKEMNECKAKPDLTNKSREIINNKFKDNKPIHNRLDEIINEKKFKLDYKNYYYNVLNNKELQESLVCKTGIYNEERFNDFVENQKRWLKSKNEKIETLQEENNKAEIEASKTFYKPNINKKSESIARKNNTNTNNVHKRLYTQSMDAKEKKERLAKQNIPSFSPVINKKLPKNFNKNKPIESKENYQVDTLNETNHSLYNKYNIILQQSNNPNPIEDKVKKDVHIIAKKIIESKGPSLEDQLDRANEDQDFWDEEDSEFWNSDKQEQYNLYKLNIQDNSNWQDKPNRVMFKPDLSNLFKYYK